MSVIGCTASPGPIREDGYQLVLFDDFKGTTLNDDVWNTVPYGTPLPPVVGFDVVTLKATAANNYQWAYLGALGPRSETEPNYPQINTWRDGYFEARFRFTDDPWAWPAMWLFSASRVEAWPGEDCSHLTAEWDIMENGVPNAYLPDLPASDWYFTAVHQNTSDGTADGYCGQADTQRYSAKDLEGNLSDWHVWAGRWTDNELCTYLDDIPIQCMTPYDSMDQPMTLVFSMWYLHACINCPPRPSELEMQVDWVKVWQKTD